MSSLGFAIVLGLAFASAIALPAQMNDAVTKEEASWKSVFMDGTMEDLQKDCAEDNTVACMKIKVFNFVDDFFTKSNFKISEDVSLVQNSYDADVATSARSADDVTLVERVENYLQSHDVVMALPGSTMTFSPRNLDAGEVNFSLDFDAPTEARSAVEGKSRKSKIKKILIPILMFVLLKAMTLIPLFIGALGLKAWNALQLSFFSFVISVGLAVFQLCKKIAADSAHAHPVVAAHNPWEYSSQYAARASQDGAQDMAYSAYSE